MSADHRIQKTDLEVPDDSEHDDDSHSLSVTVRRRFVQKAIGRWSGEYKQSSSRPEVVRRSNEYKSSFQLRLSASHKVNFHSTASCSVVEPYLHPNTMKFIVILALLAILSSFGLAMPIERHHRFRPHSSSPRILRYRIGRTRLSWGRWPPSRTRPWRLTRHFCTWRDASACAYSRKFPGKRPNLESRWEA